VLCGCTHRGWGACGILVLGRLCRIGAVVFGLSDGGVAYYAAVGLVHLAIVNPQHSVGPTEGEKGLR